MDRITEGLIRFLSLWIAVVLLISGTSIFAQDNSKQLEQKLNDLSKTIPALNEKVSITMKDVSIQGFLQAVANNVGLNLSIDPSVTGTIVNNFSDVRVADMLLFMANEYGLEINTIGNILSITKRKVPPPEKPVIKPREIKIFYDKPGDLLSMELRGDTLSQVAKAITQLSGKNVVPAPGTGDKIVNAFIQNMAFDKVLEMFAFANNMELSITEDGFYLLSEMEVPQKEKTQTSSGSKKSGNTSKNSNSNLQPEFEITVLKTDTIAISALNSPIQDILTALAEKLHKNYHFVTDLEGTVTLKIDQIAINDLLDFIFNGTKYAYKQQKGIYIIGDSKLKELQSFHVVPMQYRTIEKVIDVIPSELKKDVEIKEFKDQNCLLLSGNISQIEELEYFLQQIDKVVPVILIEVIIVDVTSKYLMSTGIRTGIGTEPATTSGSIYPGIDMTLSASSLNNLIESFNGFGWLNLGKVTPNFYIQLKALEDNGIIRMRSTPKLSTLNGSEAELSIGKTEYYLEEQNNVVGTQNPQNIMTKRYQSVNADLTVKIKPVVSGDEQVTLDISVSQSDFTARISPSAPPGKVTRDFKSLIRIKNQEMVLLGGLEDRSSSDTGTGLPLLSRIPVLKWIFSYRSKEKNTSKLNIFIKPTVIY